MRILRVFLVLALVACAAVASRASTSIMDAASESGSWAEQQLLEQWSLDTTPSRAVNADAEGAEYFTSNDETQLIETSQRLSLDETADLSFAQSLSSNSALSPLPDVKVDFEKAVSYVMEFNLKVDNLQPFWRNVISRGKDDSDRTPSIFIYPSGSRIHFRQRSGNEGNSGCDSEASVAVGQWAKFRAEVSPRSIRIFINDKLDNACSLAGDANWGQKVNQIRRDSYGNSNGAIHVKDFTFNQVPAYKYPQLPTLPIKLEEKVVYTVDFDILIKATWKEWRNVFSHGADDSDRTPAVFVYPSGTRIHFRHASTRNGNDGLDTTAALPLNQWAHVQYRVYHDRITAFIDNKKDSESVIGPNHHFTWGKKNNGIRWDSYNNARGLIEVKNLQFRILQDSEWSKVHFDEKFYLGKYSDVAAAVRNGDFPSGYVHYKLYGKRSVEMRSPNPFVDFKYYLSRYDDIAKAVNAGSLTPHHHYYTWGHVENRRPSRCFNPRFYLEKNPDVAAAVKKGQFKSAYEHFMRHGRSEGRKPSKNCDSLGGYTAPAPQQPSNNVDLKQFDDWNKIHFDEKFYLNKYSDVKAAVEKGQFPNAAAHYHLFGKTKKENRSPNPFVDLSWYLAQNADVAAAAKNDVKQSSHHHFFTFGHKENRAPSRCFDPAFYLKNNQDVQKAVDAKQQESAYMHFMNHGKAEGRKPSAACEADGSSKIDTNQPAPSKAPQKPASNPAPRKETHVSLPKPSKQEETSKSAPSSQKSVEKKTEAQSQPNKSQPNQAQPNQTQPKQASPKQAQAVKSEDPNKLPSKVDSVNKITHEDWKPKKVNINIDLVGTDSQLARQRGLEKAMDVQAKMYIKSLQERHTKTLEKIGQISKAVESEQALSQERINRFEALNLDSPIQ